MIYDRYYLTGLQLKYVMNSENQDSINNTLKGILDNQFIGRFRSSDWKRLVEQLGRLEAKK